MTASPRLLALLASAATVATPTLAEARGKAHRPAGRAVTATVLRADRAHHRLLTAKAGGRAATWKVSGTLPKRAALGSRVTFRARGRAASHVKVVGRLHRLALGAVVTGQGTKRGVRLPAGLKLEQLRGHRGLAALLRLLAGLAPGSKVTITLTLAADGSATLSVTLPDGTVLSPGHPDGGGSAPGDHAGDNTGGGSSGDDTGDSSGGGDTGGDNSGGGDNPGGGDTGGGDTGGGGSGGGGNDYDDPLEW